MTDQEFIAQCEELLSTGEKPTVPQVAPLVKEYYDMPGNAAGGSLHVVLDDYNLADSYVQFCIEWSMEQNDKCGEMLGRVLYLMSRTQRKKVTVYNS